MKKLSKKQRDRDVVTALHHRKGRTLPLRQEPVSLADSSWKPTNAWINDRIHSELNVSIDNKKRITLYLPEEMNFFEGYESTVLHISAIRKLAITTGLPRKAYKLVSVNFDNLKKISTSAALVLTAELSKWDDAVRQKLRPSVDNWDQGILKQFTDLGFFDLFHNNSIEQSQGQTSEASKIRLVRYIKGRCGDSAKTRVLKNEIADIVGDTVSKWTFLHSGLTEAITNVSHHAYPDEYGFSERDRNWYLTGSFNDDSKELKIVFYDQGIGIPKSLPESDVWEKILKYLSGFAVAERKKDEVLLRAAVVLDRTSTLETDRGKGLQDLLEFIRQSKGGYLSILSLKGLFKFSMHNGKEKIKSEHFDNSICGTLIIWSVTL